MTLLMLTTPTLPRGAAGAAAGGPPGAAGGCAKTPPKVASPASAARPVRAMTVLFTVRTPLRVGPVRGFRSATVTWFVEGVAGCNRSPPGGQSEPPRRQPKRQLGFPARH